MGDLDTLTIVLIAAIAVLLLVLHIVYGIICSHIAGRKGRSTKGYFWAGFLLGLFGVLIIEVKPVKTFALNANVQQSLMYITFMHQWGALTDEEFKREKKVLYWMNHYLT